MAGQVKVILNAIFISLLGILTRVSLGPLIRVKGTESKCHSHPSGIP